MYFLIDTEIHSHFWHFVSCLLLNFLSPISLLLSNTNCFKVFAKLKIPEEVSRKVDFFLTKNAEAVALGSLRNPDDNYAFIGLPHFCIYEEPSDIPVEDLNFASYVYLFFPEFHFKSAYQSCFFSRIGHLSASSLRSYLAF